MPLRLTITVITVAAIALTATYAQNASFGTPAEAKAMLEKVVMSMKADPAKTVSQINSGEGGFRDRDLYPTCAGPDGRNIAHPDPARIGLVQKDIKDVTGKPYGAEFASAVEDKFTEVTYMYPRPGEDKRQLRKSASLQKWLATYASSDITSSL
jgi:Single Cache domain 2